VIELVVVLEQIEEVLKHVLTFYHDHGLSWGWSIVALTVTVRLAILPLTVKQFRSMAAMQSLQPEIKKVQAKYKDKKDPESRKALQQEMMELYRENNVNPFASCLPLLFQLPIFIGLFYTLNTFAKSDPPGSPAFLGIDNIFLKLSDIGGATEVIVVLLYLASMLGSTLLFSFVVDKQQKYLFAGMSVFFVFFIVNVPVGVGIYWITTNLWTIAQQGIIKQTMGHHFPHLQRQKEEKEKDASRGMRRSSRTPPKAEPAVKPAKASGPKGGIPPQPKSDGTPKGGKPQGAKPQQARGGGSRRAKRRR
jgi:YidC/Oxa1 family membrane protein insertase